MSFQVEKIVRAFRQAVLSTPISVNIWGKDGAKILTVSSSWDQSNIERKQKMVTAMFQTANLETKEVITHGCSDASENLLSSYSASNTLKAIVREVPAAGKTPKKQYIEVWRNNLMIKQFDLQSWDVHGDIYTDSDFGSFEWSVSEEQIMYVAEAKVPKTESFLSTKSKIDSDDKTTKGNEYLFTQDWGEQLVGKCKSVLAVADLIKDEVRLVEVKDYEDYFLGSGTWAPDGGVIAVAYVIEPRRLGRVFCTNRPSYIVHISPEGDVTKLSEDGLAVFGPKFSPDKSKLIWFQRESGGPHHSCVSLVKYEWASKVKTTVIDTVIDQATCTGGQPFYGLYNHVRPPNCWLSDNKTVILSTQQRASVKTYAIDTDSGLISEIDGASNEEYSQGVLDVWRNYAVCWRSSLQCFPGLYLAEIEPSNINNVVWLPLVESKAIEENYTVNILRLEGETWNDPDICVRNYSAIYFGPKNGENIPLIVWSHGGPHSASSNIFNKMAYFYSKLGFAMLTVNYRGSIGAGMASVNHLLGRIGFSDVSDVYLAHKHTLKVTPNIDASKCVLFGGSHGGFLSLHLAGQYSDSYVSCSALNPVANLTQFLSSDIPDWGFVEAGLKYSPCGNITKEHYEKLWKASPQYYVDKVKIPVLLLIGSKDLRVPSHQGINYYYMLKEHGKAKTKLHLYEDNHPLALFETDFIINTAVWFMESLK